MLKTYGKLLDLLTPQERIRFWILVGLSFVLSVVEAVSVLSILPFLQLLANPELIETNETVAWVYGALGFTDPTRFLIWTGVAVFIVTVFGLIMKAFGVWLTTRFALMRAYSISSRLLTAYLHQPYAWFLSRHSSQINNMVLAETNRVVWEALLPAVRIIPEVFTVLLLVGALCLIEPWISIGGAILLGGIYGLIYLAVRRWLGRLGEIQLTRNRDRFHVVQEATGGVKELKIMGLESQFITRFRDAALPMAKVQSTTQVIIQMPRFALEATAFGGMILLILYLLATRTGNLVDIIPMLGVIATVGLRLIPALQQIYFRLSSLRQSQPVLQRVHDDMGLAYSTDHLAPEPLHMERALSLHNVGYNYPDAERPALNGVTITIEKNTSVGIVGGTGAGKTTLVDIILGLLHPGSGKIEVDDALVTDENRTAWQRSLGYVPQTIFLSDGTVAQNIAFGVPDDEIDMAAVEKAARIAALHDFIVTELADGYQTRTGERGVRLSGGQRQRIGIARALYHNPSMLIFDEATSALDNLTEAAVMSAVSAIAGQKTIVMIAHRLSTVRNCDQIYLFEKGKVIAAGSYDALLETSEEFRRLAAGS